MPATNRGGTVRSGKGCIIPMLRVAQEPISLHPNHDTFLSLDHLLSTHDENGFLGFELTPRLGDSSESIL